MPEQNVIETQSRLKGRIGKTPLYSRSSNMGIP